MCISKNIKIPTYSDVRNAYNKLTGILPATPLLYSPLFHSTYSISLYVKCDSLTPTGAFKIRGALYALLCLNQQQRAKGVLTFSTGNHAQAIAYSGSLLQIPTTVIMPKSAPKIKIENTKNLGATLVYFDPEKEDREEIAEKYIRDKGLTFVHPYDDFHVIAGQGVSGLECALQLKERNLFPDQFYLPVSGGGLLSGFSLGIKKYYENTPLIGVESDANLSWTTSMLHKKRTTTFPKKHSICDAIMPPAPKPGELPWKILKNNISHIESVSDLDAIKGMACAMKYFGLVLEASGASTLGLLLRKHKELSNKTIVAVVSGRNLDLETLEQSLPYFNSI